MKPASTTLSKVSVGILSMFLLLLLHLPGLAQTFSSGSSGADGAFSPAADVTVPLPPDGVFHYTTVTIPSGVTVTYQRNVVNTPVIILATGDVNIAGTIDVSGAQGGAPSNTGPVIIPGSAGGPGGFDGGSGEARGGGTEPGPGQGLAGGSPSGISFSQISGNYGASPSFVSLLPLFGGSGGAGGDAFSQAGNVSNSGGSGGGGGGSILVASSTRITVDGSVVADGGANRRSPLSSGTFSCTEFSISPGAGSGGAIRLVAPEVLGTGSLLAQGGKVCQNFGGNPDGFAGAGRIRVESLTLGFTGTAAPGPSLSPVLNPASPTGSPALVNLPTITVTAVGGSATPATTTGAFATPDVILPPGTTNPIQVNLAASNIPLGATLTLRLTRQFADATSFSSTPLSGTFEASTATADVNFPPGEVSLVLVFSSFTLPQLSSLFPVLDGEPIDRIMVATDFSGRSTLSLIDRSGAQVPIDHLSPDQQLMLARGLAIAHAIQD